jgi:Uncharacterised protein family (UPF0158)
VSAAQCRDENVAGLVRLDAIIDALESQSESFSCHLDRSTVEIHAVSEDALRMADEDPAASDTIPEWQQEEVELARTISASDRYINLPTQWDVNEWAIMKPFCYCMADDQLCAEFLTAIQGRGAFRHFKNQLTHHDLWESWNQFRHLALRDLVIEWCQENSVAFVAT